MDLTQDEMDDLSEDGSYTDMDPGRDHDPFSVPDLSELSKVGNNRDEEFQQKGDALYIDKDTDRIFVLKDDDPNNTPILLKDTWQGETFPAHLNNSYGDDERKVYAVEEINEDDDSYYLLAIRQKFTDWMTGERATEWETVQVNLDGIIEWDTSRRIDSIGKKELLFNEDLDRDGT